MCNSRTYLNCMTLYTVFIIASHSGDDLISGDVPDVYWFAQALYLTGQYHRAENMLKTAKLDKVGTLGLL